MAFVQNFELQPSIGYLSPSEHTQTQNPPSPHKPNSYLCHSQSIATSSSRRINMHVALETDDIICEIFGHVRRYASKDTLTPYHAALVCKGFSPHALDALWFSMKTIETLKALIPDTLKVPLDNVSLHILQVPLKSVRNIVEHFQ